MANMNVLRLIKTLASDYSGIDGARYSAYSKHTGLRDFSGYVINTWYNFSPIDIIGAPTAIFIYSALKKDRRNP